jgi:hypothetical protein
MVAKGNKTTYYHPPLQQRYGMFMVQDQKVPAWFCDFLTFSASCSLVFSVHLTFRYGYSKVFMARKSQTLCVNWKKVEAQKATSNDGWA